MFEPHPPGIKWFTVERLFASAFLISPPIILGSVAQSALGRGLENLMKGGASPSTEVRAGKKAQFSAGMAVLVRGGNEAAKPEQPEPRASTPGLHRAKRLLKGSLILADLLLVGLVIYLVFRSHGTFGFVEVSLCVIAVVMGSWLTCLALWLE